MILYKNVEKKMIIINLILRNMYVTFNIIKTQNKFFSTNASHYFGYKGHRIYKSEYLFQILYGLL